MRAATLSLVLLIAGCETTPPEISIDISPVNCGIRSTDPDLDPYEFNLQLINLGEQTLVIEDVVYRGDQNCSFNFEGPDVTELGFEETAFIRGFWAPTVEGEDQIAMEEVSSNAENHPLLVVPICGLGVAPGTEDAEPIECQVPPEDQRECVD